MCDSWLHKYISTQVLELTNELIIINRNVIDTLVLFQNERKRYIDAETSVDNDDLNKALNKDQVIERLKFTRDWLNEHFIDDDYFVHNLHHYPTSKIDKDSAV